MSAPHGSLATALHHGRQLLVTAPHLALEQAEEILRLFPDMMDALLLKATALRLVGELVAARDLLSPMLARRIESGELWLEQGLCLSALGDGSAATVALHRAVALLPEASAAWRALGDQLGLMGDSHGADQAYGRSLIASVQAPELVRAADALNANELAVAEPLLRDHLKAHPTDVAAIRMLAELATRLGRNEDAENLLIRCLELAPGFHAARHNHAIVLYRQSKNEAALAEVNRLLAQDARHPSYRNLKAAVLVRVGDYQAAIDIYNTTLKEYPRQPKGWMSYGHALKTVGRQAESIDAYRRSLKLQPSLGEAWWSLANLKTFRFAPDDVATMKAQLTAAAIDAEDRFHIDFALGKALEDCGDYASSFDHYAAGNAVRSSMIKYSADTTTAFVDRMSALFTQGFFTQRSGGCPAADPIFILGLPRAGSTLIEQILASHSQVEGTMELPDIISMIERLRGPEGKRNPRVLAEKLASLTGAERNALGAEYLDRTRHQRKSGRPFFIDKMPNNWMYVGFIQLILPNAKIIDARRHPLGCCFSGFKQHFARGQSFSYTLTDLGRYYADYVRLMVHFDHVLPGRIHRVIYESMVTDTTHEIRRLLDYCGLPFEEPCLHFHQTERAVRTASAQQVRQPIFHDALEQWKHYDPWLEPLKTALGPVLGHYPAAPPAVA